MKKNQARVRNADATKTAAPAQSPDSSGSAAPKPENPVAPAVNWTKRPRQDGQPGLEWEAFDYDAVIAAENLDTIVAQSKSQDFDGRHILARPDGSLVYSEGGLNDEPILFRDISPAEAWQWTRDNVIPEYYRADVVLMNSEAGKALPTEANGTGDWLEESHKDLSLGLPMPAGVALTYDTLIGVLAETIFAHRSDLAKVLVVENPDDFTASENTDVIRIAAAVSRGGSLGTMWGDGAKPKLPRRLPLAGIAGRREWDTGDMLMCFAEFFHDQSDLIRRKLVEPAENYEAKIELAEALVISEACIDDLGNLTELGDEDAEGRRTSSAQRLAWRIKAERGRAESRKEWLGPSLKLASAA